MDQKTTINELKEMIEKFVQDREWAKYHDPKSLSMALAIEAAELMDIFKWHTYSECTEIMKQDSTIDAVRDELADIVIYSLAFASRNRIDVADAVKRKIQKNSTKYPVQKFKGSAP